MVGADAKALHHAAAHHPPAQRAHHFPEHDAIGIDAAARRLIAGEQLLARAKAADRLVDLAKTPGADADPAQILHGIAGMRELPVQHGADAVGADDEIAMAEITMHQRHLLRRPGSLAAPVTPVAPAQQTATQRPSSCSINCPKISPGAVKGTW